jgi:tetratricopeptide (TPR) repeat protein
MRTGVTRIFVGLLLAAPLAPAAAQDALSEARDLYLQAYYGQALDRLDRMAVVAPTADVHQYRALALLALGQRDAAERAMSAAVVADPFFRPSPDVAAPRVIEMFAAARRRLLPTAIRRQFAEATALYKDGKRADAGKAFETVLRLLDDPALRGEEGLSDIALAAEGFAELTRAQIRPAPIEAPPPLTAAPPRADVWRALLLAGTAERQQDATIGADAFTPPVALDQTLPPWTPADRDAGRTYAGAIQLVINESGRVVAARRMKTVHPVYDVRLLEAARQWRYRPALRNGRPVPAELVVEVTLSAATS